MTTLIEEVTRLNNEYVENIDTYADRRKVELDKKRQEARALALKAITDGCEDKIRAAATFPGRTDGEPRREARIYEWKHNEEQTYNGCYLRDLLNKGPLLDELQMWFDQHHSAPEGGRAFMVYYVPLASNQPNDRKYGIFVSWDKNSWNRIGELIQRNKSRFDGSFPKNGRNNSYSGRTRNSPNQYEKVNQSITN
jgi:hypothetical protein